MILLHINIPTQEGPPFLTSCTFRDLRRMEDNLRAYPIPSGALVHVYQQRKTFRRLLQAFVVDIGGTRTRIEE